MSIRSMTGFARIRRASSAGEIILNLKSVNHRGLDLHFHLPPELDQYENLLRATVKRQVLRGHLDVRVSLIRSRDSGEGTLNRGLLSAWISAFRTAAEEFNLTSEPDLNSALRIPGMFGEPIEEEFGADFQASLATACEQALAALNEFRSREGSEIVADINTHISSLRDATRGMEAIRGRALEALQSRLTERLGELLRSTSIDPQRLAQEVAVLTDRSDIGEEIARLKIHTNQLTELLDGSGEVGKRLDFLLQEMNREANTILSKTGGIGEIGLGITDLALGAKAAIEKIREQALNLE